MVAFPIPGRLLVVAGVALLTLTACSKLGFGQAAEMSWARAALERNPRLQVVAADPQGRTFTVRLKDTGELRILQLDDIAAGPVGVLPQSAVARTVPGSAIHTNNAATQVAPADSNMVGSGESPSGSNGTELVTAGELARPSSGRSNTAAVASTGAPEAQIEASGWTTLTPSHSNTPVHRSLGSSDPSGEPTHTSGAPSRAPVLRSVPLPGSASIPEAGAGATVPAGRTSGLDSDRLSPAMGAELERRHDPIICEGARLMRIDNRNLEFDGDAVSAQDGCEIDIANSRISAKGIGVSARAANVHIENSEIVGGDVSINAEQGAHVYVKSSHFTGLRRRLDNAVVDDLGGNVWH